MNRADARRRLGGALDGAGVLAPIASLRERWIAARAPDAPATGPDGLPLPPARLRVLVDGHGDPAGFLADSRAGAAMIEDTLRAAGIELADLGSLLDFGCGCGRIARNWARVEGPEVHGCDYNPELVEWCRDNLSFMDARVNAAEPPSPYDSDRFDLVYAVSIFTHLTEPLGGAWMAELRRIVAPGGLLLFTTHGASYRNRLTERERSAYDGGELVVQRAGVVGRNACAAYHPPSYVNERLLDGFDLVSHSGPDPQRAFPQDVYLARRAG
jgi:SAM-dependent methyltransferase